MGQGFHLKMSLISKTLLPLEICACVFPYLKVYLELQDLKGIFYLHTQLNTLSYSIYNMSGRSRNTIIQLFQSFPFCHFSLVMNGSFFMCIIMSSFFFFFIGGHCGNGGEQNLQKQTGTMATVGNAILLFQSSWYRI